MLPRVVLLPTRGGVFCLYVLSAYVCYNARLSITVRAYPQRRALAICASDDVNLRRTHVWRVEGRCAALKPCGEIFFDNLVMRTCCHLVRRDKRRILPEKLKKSKTLRKGVDKWRAGWYNNQAVARSGSESVLENWTTNKTRCTKK